MIKTVFVYKEAGDIDYLMEIQNVTEVGLSATGDWRVEETLGSTVTGHLIPRSYYVKSVTIREEE